MAEEDELLKVREVADRLRVDDTTVRRYIESGLIDAIVLPVRGKRKSYRVPARELEKVLDNHATQDERSR